MEKLLKILFVEDNQTDAELVIRQIKKEKISFTSELVETEKSYLAVLKKFNPDIIISDYSLPQFSGMKALLLRNELAHNTPFILVTGSVNEEVAVECIKSGADDYIIKKSLSRLGEAIKSAIRKYEIIVLKEQTEDLLESSRQEFKSYFELGSVGMSVTAPDRSWIEVNRRLCTIFGYSKEELTKLTWVDLTYPDDLNENLDFFQRAIDGKIDNYEIDKRFIRKDGKIVYVNLSVVCQRNKDGSAHHFLSSYLDITERKLFEEMIQRERNLLRIIIDNLPDPISIKDTDCKYILNNKAHLNIIGVEKQEEATGKSSFDFFDKEMASEFFKDDQDVILAGAKIFNKLEKIFNKGTNEESWHLTSKIPLTDDSGKPAHILTISHDINQRKKAEDALKKSAEFNSSLLKTIPFGMDIVDEDGNILFQSDNFRRIFGKNSIGRKCWEVYREDKKQCSDCPLLSGIRLGETDIYESHGVLGDKIFEISHTGMIYDDKKAILEIFQDISDRKESEEELIKAKEKAEESDKLKTAFLHNISHEIRTPMNAIIGFSTLLGETDVDAVTRKSYTDLIIQSSSHLLSIITDIVDISNIEANLVKITKIDFNLNSAVKTICDQLIKKAQEKGIELLYENGLVDSEAAIISDKTKVMQVLSNLVNNAIKFTSKGHVICSYNCNDGIIEFCVSDTGAGIPIDQQNKIFDRFYQVKNSMTRTHEGTGLGLAISKGYIEMLGGSIRVESEPGWGSKFYFTIPYENAASIIKSAADRETDGFVAYANKKRILVAEDIDSNFKLINYFLKGLNAEIVRAKNGIEAVNHVKSGKPFDLILMDIKMPEMDGYNASRIIKEINPSIPIVAQTAYADDRQKATDAGCSGFITKPFDRSGLLKVLSEFL